MGRNGKKAPAFTKFVDFVRENYGKVVTSKEVLLGEMPGRNKETSYLYTFIKLGYIEVVGNSKVKDPTTKFKVVKRVPDYYNSMMMKNETHANNGLIGHGPTDEIY